ncbi:MAG: cell division protein FtsZ [SAR202 cluster bacterium]|nr:cell division protein FtsZ [SAR202 cluster bacterium]
MADYLFSGGKNTNNHDVPTIKVIGAGGGGSNAVNRMYREPIPGVDYVVTNTDAQSLSRYEAPTRLQIGERITRGRGVGGDPELGRQAAEESKDELADLLRGAEMVFIAAGMGGGTGTGSAPVIAEVAKSLGALTVAVVTKPFSWEGRRRQKVADDGLHRLKEKVDAVIVIPNDRLSYYSDTKLTMSNAFRLADDVLRQGVQAIAELITIPGEINLDFADVRSVMAGAGASWMGIGYGRGENRALDAAKNAVNCPLLELTVDGAKGVIFSVTGGENLTLAEVQAAAQRISEVVDPDANIFFGMVHDPKLEDAVRITMIATGFPTNEMWSSHRDAELSTLLGNIGSTSGGGDADLDLPPFLRRTYGTRRAGVANPRSNGFG